MLTSVRKARISSYKIKSALQFYYSDICRTCVIYDSNMNFAIYECT